MKQVKVVFLLAAAAVAAFLVLSASPSRSPVEFKLVSSKPVGNVNGKEFTLLTLSISNQNGVTIVFNPVDFQAKVRGQWIDVDQPFGDVNMKAGETVQQPLCVPEGVEACRLRFSFRLMYPPATWMERLVGRSGPRAERLVAKSPWLREWVWPGQWGEPRRKKIISLEVEIPPRSRLGGERRFDSNW